LAIVILAIALAGLLLAVRQVSRSIASITSSSGGVRSEPVVRKIASGQVVVKAGHYVQYRIQITPDMRAARLTGSFNASGGSGNDVTAVVAGESEFANWINGHQARVYYATPGKETTGGFDLHLGPGTYYFAVSNQFSAFSDKYVFLEVNLSYERPEGQS
jgi:uncharacterized protein (AIM24 family)